jgi:hypothetical protein
VLDSGGQPVAGLGVSWAVSGAHSLQGVAPTDESGSSAFCYTGSQSGADTVKASVRSLSDSATMTWVAVPSNYPPEARCSDVTVGVACGEYMAIEAQGSVANAIRSVHVSDTLPPELQLRGASEMSHPCGGPWQDPGIEAMDAWSTSSPHDGAVPGFHRLGGHASAGCPRVLQERAGHSVSHR